MPRTVPWKEHIIPGWALRCKGGGREAERGRGPQRPGPGSQHPLVSLLPQLLPPQPPGPPHPPRRAAAVGGFWKKKNNQPQKVLFTPEIK